MKKNKGCLNENCEAFQKHIYFKETEKFCSQCGQPLHNVCQNKRCYKPVSTGEKYCILCEAEQTDKKEKALDVLEKAGGIVVGVGGTILTVITQGKTILDSFRKH